MTDEEKNRPVTQWQLLGYMKLFIDLYMRVMALERSLKASHHVEPSEIESYVAWYQQYQALLKSVEDTPDLDELLELLKRFDGPIQ